MSRRICVKFYKYRKRKTVPTGIAVHVLEARKELLGVFSAPGCLVLIEDYRWTDIAGAVKPEVRLRLGGPPWFVQNLEDRFVG
jgi:hypothetical protein